MSAGELFGKLAICSMLQLLWANKFHTQVCCVEQKNDYVPIDFSKWIWYKEMKLEYSLEPIASSLATQKRNIYKSVKSKLQNALKEKMNL